MANYQQALFDIRKNAPDQETAARQIAAYSNQPGVNLNSSQIAGAFGVDPSKVGEYAQRYNLSINADMPVQPQTNLNLPNAPAEGANTAAFSPNNYIQAATDQGDNNQWAAEVTNRMSNPNISNPLGSQTVTYGPDGTPTVSQNLSDDFQGLFGRALEGVSKPLGEYRFSKVDDPTAAGQSAVVDALRAREQPRFDRARSQTENDLLVRGFNPGTEGFSGRMDDLNRMENDFNLGLTTLGGQEQQRLFNMQTENRGREIGEAQTARGQGINEFSALAQALGMALPSQPFQGAGRVEASPIFDAMVQAGLFDLGKYNTQVQGELGTRQIDMMKKEGNRGALFDVWGAAMDGIAKAITGGGKK